MADFFAGAWECRAMALEGGLEDDLRDGLETGCLVLEGATFFALLCFTSLPALFAGADGFFFRTMALAGLADLADLVILAGLDVFVVFLAAGEGFLGFCAMMFYRTDGFMDVGLLTFLRKEGGGNCDGRRRRAARFLRNGFVNTADRWLIYGCASRASAQRGQTGSVSCAVD
ncbi:hypothetical protein [Geminisphaera colitermitum]|uniref:hypothetical protein n=1 Tax=Geminisphaera colitermitum TaxID=1148786 RepID=UPI0012FF3227|nr:hypothetical protein [Geminisphaera colitermitum]